MKDIEQAISDTLAKQKKQPSEVVSLNLDSKCKSTHVKGLDAFTNLKSLSLSGIGLTSLEGFPALPKLASLTLSDNRITGGLQHLVSAGVTGLRHLDLAGNRIAKTEELAPLKSLPRLASLDLLACPVSTEDLPPKLFEMLDELKYLNGADKAGLERDGDEEEDFEEEEAAGEEEAGADGGGEGEEEFDDEDEGEFEEEGEKEYAVLVGEDAVDEDEEADYVEEGEDDDEEEEGEDEQPPSAGAGGKRKREEEEGDEEGDE